MSMNRVFNTELETSLRIALLLANAESPLDVEEITVMDFVSTYSGAFSRNRKNINGNNRFMFNEYASRRVRVETAVKRLVLDGLATPGFSPEGFTYSLSDAGCRFARSLNSDYAIEYRETSMFAISYVAENGIGKVLRTINRNKIKDAEED